MLTLVYIFYCIFGEKNVLIFFVATGNAEKQQQHASPRVTLRLTNTGNNQFKSSSARQDEKNKRIAEEQNASTMSDT